MKPTNELADEIGEKIYIDIVDLIGKQYVVVSLDDGEESDVVQLEEVLPELLNRAIEPKLKELEQAHHQQLQKAREESVKALKVADNDIPPFPSAKDSESARIGFITGVAWARTRLHSELDQDNK